MSSNTIELFLKAKENIKKEFTKARGVTRKFVSQMKGEFGRLTSATNILRGALTGLIAQKVIGGFISAASSMDTFRIQLLAVTKSVKEADKALDAIREFARTSPLGTRDVVQAFVRMRAVGIEPTMEQMKTLGGVAVLFNREMTDILNSFIGLNKRTLREVGIEIDRTGSKAIIQSGNIRKVVEKDSASIRGALMETWAERFPEAIEVAKSTFAAHMELLNSEIEEFNARLGAQFLPMLKDVIVELSASIQDFQKHIKPITISILGVIAVVRTAFNALQLLVEAIAFSIVALGQEAILVFKLLANGIKIVIGGYKDLSIVVLKLLAGDFIGALAQATVFDDTSAAVIGLKEDFNKSINDIINTSEVYEEAVDKHTDDMVNSWVDVQKAIWRVGRATKKAQLEGTGVLGPPGEDPKPKIDAGAVKLSKQALVLGRKHLDDLVDFQIKKEKEVFESRQRLLEATLLLTQDADERAFAQMELKHIRELEAVRDNTEAIANIKKAHELEVTEAQRQQNEGRRKIEQDHLTFIKGKNADIATSMANLTDTVIGSMRAATKEQQSILNAAAIFNMIAAAGAASYKIWTTSESWQEGLIAQVAVVAALIAEGVAMGNQIRSQSFAGGTLFAPGGPSRINEQGGEIVNLPPGAQVTPANQTERIVKNQIDKSIGPMTINVYHQNTGDELIKMTRTGKMRDFIGVLKDEMA